MTNRFSTLLISLCLATTATLTGCEKDEPEGKPAAAADGGKKAPDAEKTPDGGKEAAPEDGEKTPDAEKTPEAADGGEAAADGGEKAADGGEAAADGGEAEPEAEAAK